MLLRLSLFLEGGSVYVLFCVYLFTRCIYPGEQMTLAPFLEKTSLDRAPGRFADNLFVRKHAKADVLLTTVLGLLRRRSDPRTLESGENWSSVTRNRPQKLANGQKLQMAAGRPTDSHRLGHRRL